MSDNSAPRKFDHGKPQVNLIPSVALIEAGKVLAFGAKKYDRGNWAKGLATSRYFDAAQRHLLAWNAGEDADPESGLSHLAHALVNLSFMLWNMTFRKDLDDRWHAAYEPKEAAPCLGHYAWFSPSSAKPMSPVFVSADLCRRWDVQTSIGDSQPCAAVGWSIRECTKEGAPA